ncbi:MAG: twin-arginine translocase TatA/TatE family subunit [Rhodospirillaceae bacterium]
MGFTSIWHWVIVLVVVLLLFGAGKIPRLMGDVAKGVNAFKKGLKDDGSDGDSAAAGDKKAIETGSTASASTSTSEEKDRAAHKG